MRLIQTSDMRPVLQYLTDVEQQHLPYASAIALTQTAVYARRQIIAEMPRVFDRPKPSTTNEKSGPLYLKTADYRKLRAGVPDYAEVRVKDTPQVKGDPAIAYLSHHITGGARIEKRSEFLLRKSGILPNGYYIVPGSGARLDKYGNMSAGQIQQILSALQAQRFTDQNTTKRSIARNKGQADYFIASRTRAQTRHLAEGVWQRYGRGRYSIRPVLIFVKGAPRYRKRLRFFEIAQQTGQFRFPTEFHLAMRKALATARVLPNTIVRSA